MTRIISRIITGGLLLALLLSLAPLGSQAAGTISLTTFGSAYLQDFDTLASSGTANTVVPDGWDFSESGTNANTTYRAGTGSDNAGDTYSFGAASNTERAFGGLRSGSLVPLIGTQFTNNTGGTITSLVISYTGEQWRLGQNTTGRAADRLDFQLSTDATSLATGTWIDYDSLDFSSPVVAGTIGALNGNVSPNRTTLNFTITGLSIPNGISFWLRWADTDLIPGADDGLAVDDFSLIPDGIIPPVTLSINDVSANEGNAGTTSFDFTVSLASPAGAGGVTFDIATQDDTATIADNDYVANALTGQTIPAGGSTYTFSVLVNGDAITEFDETFFVNVTNVTGADVQDSQGQGTIISEEVCGLPYTPIYQVQGNGDASPFVGMEVVIEGVVVGDFQNNVSPDNGNLNGFHVQDSSGDGDPATSDGLFVFAPGAVDVSIGDGVRVRGLVSEFNGMTEITLTKLWACSSGNTVAAIDLSLPVTSLGDFEAFEGMLVRFPQELTISEYFNYDRFGEMVLALPLDGESRAFTPTSIVEPGTDALARALANSLHRITLDDGLTTENPSFVRHPNGDPFSLENRFRGGDIVRNATGVIDYSFGLYRIQPTGPADYTAINLRPAAPEAVGGSLRVAAMNTLNFFLTQDYPTGNPLDNKCGPLKNVECRGADANQPLEFTRQRAKLLAALAGLNADVIGLNEIENTTGVEPLADVVAGLNAAFGPGTYAYIDTGVIGTDAIRVGLIYKPAKVAPVSAFQTLDSTDDPRFIDTKSRPALAQTFQDLATGGRFTVVVNHLKSKGSACDDIGDFDAGDGQGNCSGTRTLAAQALVDWLATDPTGSGDRDFLIMGDLNSYAQEDPIDAVKAGADNFAGTGDDYTNLIAKYQGKYAYSYVFDGQAGYLDHALANISLAAQVTGATEWHLNADEPDLLDYDTSFKPAAQDALYEPNAYRSSDHDAVVIGLDLFTQSTSFVTGGGWIDSPQGKTEFIFDAKYKKDATVPTGEFTLLVEATSFNFYSNTFDWLMVIGSAAYLKGTAGELQFLLVAEDGNPDTLQVMIWDEFGVVFNSEGTQPLGGGSIKIH